MGAITKIQWCHHTMNFWTGCQKVSPACDFCYAENWAKRAGHPELWQGERKRTSKHNWREPYKWNAAARAAGERRRVFVNSLADFFDNQVPEEWRADATKVMIQCEHLDWLILTKRPQNIPNLWPSAASCLSPWLGTTVENQEEAERRIPHLLKVPAAVHFLSMEPLLGPVEFEDGWFGTMRWRVPKKKPALPPSKDATLGDIVRGMGGSITPNNDGIDWVIVGGESGGQNRREFRYSWAKSIIEACHGANVACFVKQVGSHPVDDIHYHIPARITLSDKKGGLMEEWPPELQVRQFPHVRALATCSGV